LAALISLVQLDLAPAWMVAVLLGRDFAVTGLRSLAYSRGVVVPASQLGKIKMVAQVIAILALILAHGRMREFYLDRLGQAALWIAVIVSLASAADYFRRFTRILHPDVAPFPTARERSTTSLTPQATSRTPSATNRKQA
jgi:CDP-diacylglycerol--glycerol-3-phosphate 3-phosphatidyltransferase